MGDPGRAALRQVTLALVASLCLLPAARAQTAGGGGASIDPSRGGLGLKLQRELLPPEAPGHDEALPVFLEADRIEGVQDRSVEARGNVVVRRRGETLFTDSLSYSIPDNAITASGNVTFRRLNDVVTGDRGVFDLDTNSGSVDNPSYRFPEYRARGKANRLNIRDRNRYRAERATYTNCAVGDDDWYLRVSRLDLDRLRDVGVARNATVYFKGLPIMYTPWIDFPLTSRRKTGFLPPTIGTTNNSGFEVATPFYWNIAPNRDYTIVPRLLSKRGVLVDNEFRYLERDFNGTVKADILPDDRLFGATRWAYAFQHSQLLTQRLRTWLNFQGVSDDTYFTDLSNSIANTSQTNLPREAGLTYNGDWWSLLVRAQSFQTLQDPNAPPVTPPYARLPQLVLHADQPDIGGFDLHFFGEAVNFSQSNAVTAVRQVYYPYVTYPMRRSFFYVTPKLGLNYTAYNYTDSNQSSDSRMLPIFSLDSGMEFARRATFFGRAYRQTLEPRVYYVYIPFREQNQLPVFDTAQADFNLPELFTENQFSGWDRVNNANQITAAVTTRLIDPKSGAEWVRGTLAQRYYFEEQRVALPGQQPPVNNSDLLLLLNGNLAYNWSTSFGLHYNVDNGQADKLDAALRYRPQPGKLLNFGYRYTRNFLEQIDLSAVWPLSRRWSGVARWNYSLPDKTTLDGLVGVEYNADCWAARLVYHTFVTGTNERSTGVFLQVELSGLARLGLGGNPLQLLRQSISGYESTGMRQAPEVYYPGLEYE